MRELKAFFLVIDLGFLAYWGLTALHLIPLEYAFKELLQPSLGRLELEFLAAGRTDFRDRTGQPLPERSRLAEMAGARRDFTHPDRYGWVECAVLLGVTP